VSTAVVVFDVKSIRYLNVSGTHRSLLWSSITVVFHEWSASAGCSPSTAYTSNGPGVLAHTHRLNFTSLRVRVGLLRIATMQPTYHSYKQS